ncbi:restriction endonuclease subunit S [Brenneria rubrifaciens]|uniref:Restriction endonuclease subunit S n=1 Tax=Brenneria rubrifaciens TaxID=55213 RepID=A0A4P8QX75_9GAMM|nr:restriction endonuclease subunit S [Brenneria rubrifaciens]QCR10210.1 restriction endonuclease subunit S [Brenneria rubrifaciens]
MASKWVEVPLEQLKAQTKSAFAMGPFGSKIKAENFTTVGVPVIKGGNLNATYLDESDFDFLTQEKADELESAKARRLDIVITHRGTLGQVGLIPEDSKYEEYVVSQSQLKMSFDIKRVDPYFVYYFLKSPLGQSRLLSNASQVGVPAIAQALTSVRAIEIPIPENRSEQVRISSVLRSLDDKIDLNCGTNQTLEAMAQAIFKSWFVDFDPVKARITAIEQGEDPLRAAMRTISGKTDAELDQMPREHHDQLAATAALFPEAMEESELGEIPKGWEVVPASALIEFNPKEPLRKGTVAPYLDMASLPTSGSWAEPPVPREFGSGMRFRNGDALLARITPCLENGKSAFVQNLPDETVGWGSTEFIVMRSKNPVPREYAYLLVRHAAFREHAIRSMTGTSGRQRAQADAVAGFKVVSPSEISVWFAFSHLLDSCFKVIKCQSEAVEKLAELRDILLPQLISGELAAPSDLNDGESQ